MTRDINQSSEPCRRSREWLATPEGQLHIAVTDSLPHATTALKFNGWNWRDGADVFIRHLNSLGFVISAAPKSLRLGSDE